MLQYFNKFGWHVSSNVLAKAMPLLAMPFFTRVLSPEDFGLIAIFNIVFVILISVVGLSGSVQYIQKFNSLDPTGRFSFRVSILKVSCLVSVVVVALATLLAFIAPEFFSTNYRFIFASAVVAAFSGINLHIITTDQMMMSRVQSYFVVINLPIAIGILISVASLNSWDWYGRIVGLAFGPLIVLAAFWTIDLYRTNLRTFLSPLDRIQAKLLISNGIKLLPHSIAGSFVVIAERTIIGSLSSVEFLGLYYVAYLFAQINDVVLSAIWRTLQPKFYAAVAAQDKIGESAAQRIVLSYVLVALVCSGVCYFFVDAILLAVVSENFERSADIAKLLTIGLGFFNIASAILGYIIAWGLNSILSLTTALASISSIAISATAIFIFGEQGAAFGFVLGNISFVGFALAFAYFGRNLRQKGKL